MCTRSTIPAYTRRPNARVLGPRHVHGATRACEQVHGTVGRGCPWCRCSAQGEEVWGTGAGPGVLLGLARATLSVVIVLSSSYIMRWP
ncbi:hypothetical protein BJV77DRAFT_1047551 [Russula vinacea]|nr:hypothetical protein BJV77DRAFT_1047551 [Russula vinacea]